MHFWIVGVNNECLFPAGYGFIKPVQLIISNPKINKSLNIFGIDGQGTVMTIEEKGKRNDWNRVPKVSKEGVDE